MSRSVTDVRMNYRTHETAGGCWTTQGGDSPPQVLLTEIDSSDR